jgi:mannitol-specific phosphotransferase system IIBC component
VSAVLGRLLLNFLKSGLTATPLTRALSCPHEQIEQLWRHGGAADGRPGSIAGAVVGQGELQGVGAALGVVAAARVIVVVIYLMMMSDRQQCDESSERLDLKETSRTVEEPGKALRMFF